ncbi:hypothetical protein [Nostoc sp. WHI]|uniref:hypothetical protein n=1 Tax=Nostoc sp. WHI TaxID=2650611 RepID=UPI0018C4E23F|nr:hypothetical protein [Nostoc sp. WHI]MBG1270075.1 hypothetical protein [Nostoc sp. WHI]
MRANLGYPNEELFNPSLAKSLNIQQLATTTQLVIAKLLRNLGELSEESIDWKMRTKQIQKATYKKNFVVYRSLIKDF